MQNDESRLKSFFKKKWVRIVVVVDILAMIFLVGVMIWNSTRTAILTLNVAPVDARIQVGSNVFQNGTYKMHPGTYDVTVSRDGLDTKSFVIELGAGDALYFSVFLKSSENGFGFYTLEGNFESFRKLTEIAGKNDNNTLDSDSSAEEFIASFQEKYNSYISNVLPIEFTEYEKVDNRQVLMKDITIRRGSADICERILCVEALMALTNDKGLVNDLLKENGLNPEDYEIHYKFY